jgi:hypothetical protein
MITKKRAGRKSKRTSRSHKPTNLERRKLGIGPLDEIKYGLAVVERGSSWQACRELNHKG